MDIHDKLERNEKVISEKEKEVEKHIAAIVEDKFPIQVELTNLYKKRCFLLAELCCELENV